MDKVLLKRKLKNHERSQRWLAKKLGITSTYVSMWCRGERPITRAFVRKIQKWLP